MITTVYTKIVYIKRIIIVKAMFLRCVYAFALCKCMCVCAQACRVQYNNIVRICIYVFCMFVDVCIRVVI